MKLAIAQMTSRAGDFEATAERMARFSRQAADQGADLVVFPKAILCGSAAMPSQDREGFFIDLADCLYKLIEDLACPAIVPVLVDVYGNPFSEAMLVTKQGIKPLRMGAMFESMSTDEDDDDSGSLPSFELAGVRMGIAFNYDDLDDYDEYDYDVDAIVFLSPYGYARDDVSSALGTAVSEGRYLSDAEQTGAWIVGVGSLGCYDSQVFVGSSFVLAPWGELAAQAPLLEEALIVANIDPGAEGPLTDPLTPEVFDSELVSWSALSLGLHDVCAQRGFEDACLIVDDTFASMLCCVLAVDALGPTHVLALVRDQGGPDGEDEKASELAHRLRLPKENVFNLLVPGDWQPVLASATMEAHLAQLADEFHALPLGFLTKTDLALRGVPATSAAEFFPFGDLYNSDIGSLAHLRNTISPVLPVSFARFDLPDFESSFEWASSPEAAISFIDYILLNHIEGETGISDIADETGHAEVVEEVIGFFRDAEKHRTRMGAGSILALSVRTLLEVGLPQGLAWSDRARLADERMSMDKIRSLAAAMGDDDLVDDDFDADPRFREKDARDMLGDLRDFSIGGAFVQDEGEGGPKPLWGSFSEN